jgi:hypothetical protein
VHIRGERLVHVTAIEGPSGHDESTVRAGCRAFARGGGSTAVDGPRIATGKSVAVAINEESVAAIPARHALVWSAGLSIAQSAADIGNEFLANGAIALSITAACRTA